MTESAPLERFGAIDPVADDRTLTPGWSLSAAETEWTLVGLFNTVGDVAGIDTVLLEQYEIAAAAGKRTDTYS